jgi:hypothetical protein
MDVFSSAGEKEAGQAYWKGAVYAKPELKDSIFLSAAWTS